MDENINTDKLEDLILMALEAKIATDTGVLLERRNKNWITTNEDQGKMLNFDEMVPTSFFSTLMMISGSEDESQGRLFTMDKDLLMCHPSEILGDTSEVALVAENGMTLKWSGYKRRKKPVKGVVCIGKPDIWYEQHYREFSLLPNRKPICQKRVAVFTKEGSLLYAKKNSHIVSDGDIAILNASIIEDATRANSMLACVSDAVTIKFPVPYDSYKELFIVRDSPLTEAGKRKAILHWVCSHMRSGRKKDHLVKQHTRGINSFSMGGIRIEISPNLPSYQRNS